MPEPKSPEITGTWEEDHSLMSAEELAKCARAYEVEDPEYPLPIPTRVVSNGEYVPLPQTEKQKRVEARVKELTESASKKLGISRRKFLASTGGLAAAFLAMNEVFGRFFTVRPEEMFDQDAFAAAAVPKGLFILDDQLHFVRGSLKADLHGSGFSLVVAELRAIAEGLHNIWNPDDLPDEFGRINYPWNPALIGVPVTPDAFHIIQYIKDIYFDSQVTVGLLSNVTGFIPGIVPPPFPPIRNVEESRAFEILTAAQTAAARDFINQIAGSQRALAHGLLYVGTDNLDYIQYQIDHHKPDSWKGYNITFAAKPGRVDHGLTADLDTGPNGLMRQWRHDDEEVAYPTFELIAANAAKLKAQHPGFNTICVHKGLATGQPPDPENGFPGDMPKALHDWPQLNFVTYHSCIQPSFFDAQSLAEIKAGEKGMNLLNGVPNISWTTAYAQMTGPFKNSFAELGTTFASSVVTFPTVTAHILGQLLKFKGEDQIVFGSDSVWYGSPQWQLEAFWRFEIPDALQATWGYPELSNTAKRKILGRNSARIYGLATEHGKYKEVPANYADLMSPELKDLLEFSGVPNETADNLSRARDRYLAMGPEPSNTRYGWVRTA